MSPAKRDREGYALIELLVLISAMAVMMGLCGGMIHLLLKLDRVGRSASDEAADMARLARDFRSDVHSSISTLPADGRLSLATAEARSVEYEARPKDILRTIREGDKIRRRETYRRPERSSVRFEITTGPAPQIASLIIGREPGAKEHLAGREVRIDAAIGLDRRSAGRPE